MKEYTYSEARQRLAALLERARREGSVRIRRKDGSVFILKPERSTPLEVPAVDLGLTREQVLAAVREGRRPT
ncbi:MAG TPA: type II toxin-antitoxin system Phd/YefM family antitoxin [Gemmatimonadaceae bacterium]|nr:type II toxin-antitoxin system Phd/YefM family antitoxin [Gemmatimonadaceae bacterium]